MGYFILFLYFHQPTAPKRPKNNLPTYESTDHGLRKHMSHFSFTQRCPGRTDLMEQVRDIAWNRG